MRKNIHPKYESIKVTCSCNNVIHTYSTVGQDFNIDVCNACHPFYTGKQRIVNTGGRLNRFYKRFSIPVVKNKSS